MTRPLLALSGNPVDRLFVYRMVAGPSYTSAHPPPTREVIRAQTPGCRCEKPKPWLGMPTFAPHSTMTSLGATSTVTASTSSTPTVLASDTPRFVGCGYAGSGRAERRLRHLRVGRRTASLHCRRSSVRECRVRPGLLVTQHVVHRMPTLKRRSEALLEWQGSARSQPWPLGRPLSTRSRGGHGWVRQSPMPTLGPG